MKKELRVLILEDNPNDVVLIRHELRKSDLAFRSKRVETKEAFLFEIQNHEPDVILSDHGIPAFDGFAALSIAKNRCPHVPFIFVTGSVGEIVAIETLKSGATDYVLKNRLSSLVPSIQRAIQESEDRQKRHETEIALRESEERFRMLVEGIKDHGIFMLDLDGRVFSWNSGAENIFGYKSSEILGKNVSTFYLSNEAEAGEPHQSLQQAIEKGQVKEEGIRVRKDGSQFWAEITLSSLHDNGGGIKGFVHVTRDVTEKKRSQQALQRSEELYRLLIEGVQDYAIFMLDTDGKIASWNIGAERMQGYKSSEIIGQKFSRFYLAEDIERGQPEHALGVAAIKGCYEDEGWRCKKDGILFWASMSLTAVKNENGELCGFSVIVRDITQKMESEEKIRKLNTELERRVGDRTAELEAINRELQAFSYSVTHDLRAPLRHIENFLSLLKKNAGNNLDDRCQKYLQTIADSTRKMDKLIEDLLAFSRMDSTEMYELPVQMNDLIKVVLHDLQHDLEGRNVEWVIGDLPLIQGDPVMLWLVLINLLSNALKFTRTRENARIEIRCSMTPQEHVFMISDNGVGFNMKDVDKLFGVFQRLHSSNEYEGSGVGLANVRRIIQRHGGRTWAEGCMDRGATFYFSLPRSIANNAEMN
jgi:PAS domain S-box-containing protein